MAGPLTTRWMQTRVGNYGGATLGVVLVDGDGAEAASSLMEFVSEITADELGEAVTRGEIDVVLEVDGTTAVLDFDPEGDPYVTDTTDTTPAGAWFYDLTGADDTEHRLLFFLLLEEGPGFPDWILLPPTDGEGCVRVRVIDDELITAVLAAITAIDGGTP